MTRGNGRAAIAVEEPRSARTVEGRWRVRAQVGADEVFVETDHPPPEGADAFLTAYVLPAAAAGATLHIEGECDATLHANLARVQEIARRYWSFPGATIAARRLVERRPTGAAAMFFTGGVDSFYTLLRRGQTLERLVFVDGFDLGLEQRARFAPVRATLETVARETGLRVEFPRTNIRRDPTFATLPWGTTFGAALAAVGHMLATSTSRILMASSSVDANWGSTPELDPLWSSGAVAFVHDGTETDKYGKMRAIADWPLAMRFLRVCFAPRRAGLNCGICEKCVRTQAMFAAIGRHDRLRTFPPGSLQERIDAVTYVPAINRPGWRITSERLGDPRLAAAIDRMLARPPPAGARLKAAAWRWFDRLPGSRGLRRIVRQARRREAR